MMNVMDVCRVMAILRPGAEWVLRGSTYEGLEWLDKTQTKPTLNEFTAALAAYVPPLTQDQRIQQLEAKIATLTGKVP